MKSRYLLLALAVIGTLIWSQTEVKALRIPFGTGFMHVNCLQWQAATNGQVSPSEDTMNGPLVDTAVPYDYGTPPSGTSYLVTVTVANGMGNVVITNVGTGAVLYVSKSSSTSWAAGTYTQTISTPFGVFTPGLK